MTLSPPMQRLAVFAGAAALLFALGFCTGTSHAPNPAIAQLDAHRDTVRDTIRVVEARIHVDTVRVAATVATAKLERRAVDSTERVVLAVADTSSTVPSSLVIPALHVCGLSRVASDTRRHDDRSQRGTGPSRYRRARNEVAQASPVWLPLRTAQRRRRGRWRDLAGAPMNEDHDAITGMLIAVKVIPSTRSTLRYAPRRTDIPQWVGHPPRAQSDSRQGN
jgi:hypothetical protein